MNKRTKRKYEGIEFRNGEDPFDMRESKVSCGYSGVHLLANLKEVNLGNVRYPLLESILHKKLKNYEPNDYFRILSNYIDFL